MLQKCYLARKHNILTSQGKYMYPLKNLSLEQLEARLLNVLTKAHASLQEVEFSLDSTKTLQFNLTVSWHEFPSRPERYLGLLACKKLYSTHNGA